MKNTFSINKAETGAFLLDYAMQGIGAAILDGHITHEGAEKAMLHDINTTQYARPSHTATIRRMVRQAIEGGFVARMVQEEEERRNARAHAERRSERVAELVRTNPAALYRAALVRHSANNKKNNVRIRAALSALGLDYSHAPCAVAEIQSAFAAQQYRDINFREV